jgi:hypothetical protein
MRKNKEKREDGSKIEIKNKKLKKTEKNRKKPKKSKKKNTIIFHFNPFPPVEKETLQPEIKPKNNPF